MKKSIIAASAASLALAAMPVVGAFAAEQTATVTDNLNVTIDNTCSLTRTASTADETVTGSSAWTDTSTTEPALSGTYTANMDAGSYGVIGKSSFVVTCNDVKNGHSVTVATTSLTDNAATGTKGAPIVYSNTTVVPAEGADQVSGWNITIANGATTPIPADSINIGILQAAGGTGTVYDKAATGNKLKQALNGATFDATYTVGASITQDAGTYVGSAIYTLTYGA